MSLKVLLPQGEEWWGRKVGEKCYLAGAALPGRNHFLEPTNANTLSELELVYSLLRSKAVFIASILYINKLYTTFILSQRQYVSNLFK